MDITQVELNDCFNTFLLDNMHLSDYDIKLIKRYQQKLLDIIDFKETEFIKSIKDDHIIEVANDVSQAIKDEGYDE